MLMLMLIFGRWEWMGQMGPKSRESGPFNKYYEASPHVQRARLGLERRIIILRGKLLYRNTNP
jgi:hypothetical protein